MPKLTHKMCYFWALIKWVWHRRLQHANWRLISKFGKLQLVRGLPNIDYHSDTLCGACQKRKIVKSSYRTKDIVSTSRPLELLHIDLFGLVNTASLYGSKYGLVIVDDYNRWTWVKFLRNKDNAYDVFSNFCTQIQSEKGNENFKGHKWSWWRIWKWVIWNFLWKTWNCPWILFS